MNVTPRAAEFYRTELASPAAPSPGAAGSLAGRAAVYRLGFTSMEILRMPEELQIGQVTVRHLIGPVETQRTTVVQQPGFAPTFVKWMERPLVGPGRPLTIYSLDVTVPDDIAEALDSWRIEVLAAAGFLSMILDERLAQELILEDVLVPSPNDNGASSYVDIQRGIRTFEPSQPWLERFAAELHRFTSQDVGPELRAACRWYLRGAAAGPTADGFVLLWIAMESLVPPRGGGQSRNQVRDVENALRLADPELDPETMIDPSIGKLAGLRAGIVHKGLESDPQIGNGFYTLEALARLLLRHRFGVSEGWPLFPGRSMLREPFASMQRSPTTEWRDPPEA